MLFGVAIVVEILFLCGDVFCGDKKDWNGKRGDEIFCVGFCGEKISATPKINMQLAVSNKYKSEMQIAKFVFNCKL